VKRITGLGRARRGRKWQGGVLKREGDESGLGPRDGLGSGYRRSSTQSASVRVVIRGPRHLPVGPRLADSTGPASVVEQRVQHGQARAAGQNDRGQYYNLEPGQPGRTHRSQDSGRSGSGRPAPGISRDGGSSTKPISPRVWMDKRARFPFLRQQLRATPQRGLQHSGLAARQHLDPPCRISTPRGCA